MTKIFNNLKYFRFTAVISLLFLSHICLFAHQGTVKGTVYDNDTKLPLIGANIWLNNSEQGAVTNEFGIYRFNHLSPGIYQVKISFIGFEAQEFAIEVKDEATVTPVTYLKASSLQLNEAIVRANGSMKDQLSSIQAIDVALRPANSSQDILRAVPGLFIGQHAGGGKAEQIFLRGFDIDHGTDIRLNVDGMPVNMVSHAHGQGYADLHFLIPETIGLTQFDKGPYYARQGDFTTAGYVDFRTKNALDKSMVKLEAGQFDTKRAVALVDVLGKESDERKQSAYIASEYLFTNGPFESSQNFRRINLMGKYHQHLNENKILTATFSHFNSQWDASGQIPQRAVDRGLIGRFGAIDDTEGGNTSRTNLNLQMTSFTENGNLFKNQFYYSHYDFELYSNFTFFLEDAENGDQIRQKEDRHIFGYNTSYDIESNLANRPLYTEIGGGIRFDNSDENELSHTKNRTTTLERLAYGDIDETNLSAYVDAAWEVSDKLNIHGGLRYDQFQFQYVDFLQTTYENQSQNKGILAPKLSLYYDVSKNLQLYGKAGIGFHSNDTRVVVAQNGTEILPKAFGTDFGMLWKPLNRLLVNMGVWRLNLEQEFVYVGDAGVVEPSGETERYGLDLSLRYQLNDWLFLDTDINLTKAKVIGEPEGANNIPLAPLFTSIGGLTVQHPSGFNGSLRYRQMGDRPANEDNSITAEGYFILDAVVKYTNSRFEVGLSIENLLDTAWNETQFDTESRLANEIEPVSEIHFTPGTPFFGKMSIGVFF
ncbi:MAG: TonB-dependent receptor [Chitinophagales bacterium]